MAQLFTFSLKDWCIKILKPRALKRHTTIQKLCREIVEEKLKTETPGTTATADAQETAAPE